MVRSAKSGKGIKGVDKVIGNLNRQIKGIKLKSAKGLIQAAIIVRRDMDKTEPKIPIDLGNLRASWRVVPFKSQKGAYITMGFTANYAVFVHEMVDADFTSPRVRYNKGKKRIYTPRAGSGAKFFSESLKRNKRKMLRVIQESAKIK